MTTLEEELKKNTIDLDYIINTLKPTTIKDTHFSAFMCMNLAKLGIDNVIKFFDLFDINELEGSTDA